MGDRGVVGPGQIISHEDTHGVSSHLSYFFIYWEKGWGKRCLGVTWLPGWDPGSPHDPSQLGGGGSEQSCVSAQVPS